jgi:hypothetical protein
MGADFNPPATGRQRDVIDGHVAYFTLASLDVPKEQELGNDIHGSKVVVIPFDGVPLDRDLQNAPPAPGKK